LDDLGFIVTAGVWTMIGAAMLIWPARVRSLTNPDWRRYKNWPLAGTSLVWYRVTGLGFVSIGIVVIFVLLNRVH
jgi:hypothetical protein